MRKEKNMNDFKIQIMQILAISTILLFVGGSITNTVSAHHNSNPIETGLLYEPVCDYVSKPNFGNWIETFDDGDKSQDYCYYHSKTITNTSIINDTLFVKQDVVVASGNYVTIGGAVDVWKIVDFEQQGNIRFAELYFEYYYPSYNGVCIPTTVNSVTGFSNSKQQILLSNKNSNFSESVSNFNAAIFDFSSLIVCDQWNIFNTQLKDFKNDFGSSFSSQSKNIGTVGFEISNAYIRNIQIRGSSEIVQVW